MTKTPDGGGKTIMRLDFRKIFFIKALRKHRRRLVASRGNVLLYVVVVMVIFGVLGVTMASLFSSSITSSATPNYHRRAAYLAESGLRYAMSEVRNSGFDSDRIETLNDTTYELTPSGTFTVNVFGPWFDAGGTGPWAGGGSVPLDVPRGEIPTDFQIPTGPDVYVVNHEFVEANPTPDGVAGITGTTVGDPPTSLSLGIFDDFNANVNDRICLASKPHNTFGPQYLDNGNSLKLYPAAQSMFPAENGAFEIRRNTFFYQASADRGSYFELLSLRVAPGSSPVTVTGNDFVILSPINHYVYAEGQSEAVVYGGDEAASVNLYDDGQLEAASRQPDISFEDFEFLDDGFRRVQTPGYIAFDDTDKRIVIDGGTGPDLGSVWFDATRSIGGQSDFCDVGECLFGVGIRAFFTLDYSGTGAGLTFALLNAVDNFAGSIGGDIQASEMLAYAGDSRLVAASPSAPEDFLDNSGVGLRPPKFALEFDTRVNFDSVFEQNLNYCSDAVNLKTNTRNDPLDNDKDAVQYVFWAGESLNIPCRDGANAGGDPVPESYDDNRHDAPGRWDFPTGNDVLSSPAVAADGTIYVGSLDGRLYAVNPDGTPRWSFPAGSAIQASPAVAPDGTVLIGSTGGVFFALNPNGSQKWRYPASGSVSEILTTAAIDPDQGPGGAVYFGTGDNALPNDARLYALDLGDGSLLWEFSPTSIGVSGDDDINSSPAIDPVTGRVIFGSDLDIVYALDPDARQSALPFPQDGEWTFNRNRTEDMDDIESRPAIDTSRNSVYVETEGFKLFALNLSNGSKRWEFELSTLRLNTTELKSSPAIGADGTVYVGSRADKLYALNPADRNAREPFPTANEWAFQTGGDVFSSPAVGDDGKIYFGSNDGFVYVAYPQGTESFKFETNGAVRSGPFVKPDGTFYVGSNDSNLYAFQPLNLGNFRQNDLPGNRYLVTYDEPGAAATPYLVSSPTDSDDWLNSGPWAIRLEVKRALIGGVGRYTFSAWIRQCEFGDCRDVVGTFFSDTRVEYDPVGKPPLLQQVIELDATANDRWDRFLFGFTAQTGADESQSASIADFALSFIRPNDPVIVADPDFP